MKLAAKVTIGVSALVVGSLLASAGLSLLPFLPQQVQVALEGTIHTVPGTIDELLAVTHGPDGKITHAYVDQEYVDAATIWPWDLPPGWGFPQSRGAADTPGPHWIGMGVKAAFQKYAVASLDAVDSGDLKTPDAANALLDEVEDAYLTLLDAHLLTDRTFIAESIAPRRS